MAYAIPGLGNKVDGSNPSGAAIKYVAIAQLVEHTVEARTA